MTIKKQFEALHALLEANKNKKVSTLMPQLIELMETKQLQKTFKTDKDGNVTHVFCYYHKEWEEVALIPYGNKKSSASGLNSMCKEGVKQWTKQQKVLKELEATYNETNTTIMSDLLNDMIDREEAMRLKDEALYEFEQRSEQAKVIIPLSE